MNICLLANHLNTGGIATYVLTLAAELRRAGHDVWVVSAPGNCVRRLEAGGARHVPMNIRVKSEVHPNVWGHVPALARLVRDRRIDILHANTRVTQIMAWAAGRLTGRPFVSTCHGYFKVRMFRRVFPCWGSGVIAISRGVKQHLVRDFGVPEAKVALIPNGIDAARFSAGGPVARQAARERWAIKGRPVLGTIARLSGVKGIDVLLRALPPVLAEFPDAVCMIAGEGPERDALGRLAESLGVARMVRFEPVLEETPDLLPALDVCIVPSRQEGLGLAALEAQAAGIPVIAARVGGLPDVIEDGRTGILFEPEQSAELASRIIGLLRAPGEAMALAAAARLRVEEVFSARRMGEATISFYEQHLRR